jgi:hypothetical protein
VLLTTRWCSSSSSCADAPDLRRRLLGRDHRGLDPGVVDPGGRIIG